MIAQEEHYILAIDLGTSAAKVALFSTQGELVDDDQEEMGIILLADGGAEQNPDDWWSALMSAAKRLLSRGAVPLDRIVALCCTGQWSGTVAIDKNGDPLMNAIIWMDSRGAPYIHKIVDGPLKLSGYDVWKLRTWVRLTAGVPGHAGKDPIAHILYIKNEIPHVFNKTFKFLEPKDYLNFRLTGKIAASIESITLHWVTDNRDLSKVDYHDRLLRMVALDRNLLPELRQSIDILGPLKKEVATELGLGDHVQVVMGTPDLQSAAIGSGAVRDHEAHLYVGTSSWLVCHVPYKKSNLLDNIASLPSAIPGRYFVATEQETSGACLTFLKDNILFHKDELETEPGVSNIFEIFDKIAEGVPAGSGKVIFTPWLYGERTPVDDRTIRAGFYNLSLETTRDHLIRAIFEGVAYNTRWLLECVESFIGGRLDWANIIGGGAKSNVWCQIFADVLNRKIRQVRDPIHANTRGAAFLASVALGYLTFEEVPDRVEILHTYHPIPENVKIHDELFKEFVQIYKRNRRMYARLNR